MEHLLTALFDRQRFSQNTRLTRLIAETGGRYGGAPLSEEDLDEVWAAGGLFPPPAKGHTHDDP